MFLPKYQWLIEEKDSECGFCDKVYIDSTHPQQFQVAFEPETLIDEDFDSDDIAESVDVVADVSDTYIFDASYNPTQDWVGTYTFLEDGIEKAYIICITADTVPVLGRVTEYGDFTLVEVNNGGGYKTNIVNAINARLPAPITAVLNGTNIEITGFPVGTQVTPGDNYPTVSGTTAGTWIGLNNFFPINDKVCFFNISDFAEINLPTTTPSIQKQVVIDAGAYVSVTVNFTNSFGFDVDFDFKVLTDGYVDTGLGLTRTAPTGTNNLTFSFTASATPPPYYILQFGLSDPAVYSEGIGSNTVGFCINDIVAEQVSFVDTIAYKDCDNVTHTLGAEDWTWSWNEKYNFLINISAFTPTLFQYIITGLDSDTINTIWYEQIDPTTCSKGRIYKLEWTDTCIVGDLDYSNVDTNFTNELYLTGVKIKQGLDKIEAIDNITSSGKKKSVYRHTIAQYEVRFHPYSDNVQSTLERAFEHSIIRIDGETFYLGDGDSYQVSELDMQVYTGRVDLYLDGSEVINSRCCC